MTPAARTFKGSFLFCPRGQIPRARRGQTHAPFPIEGGYNTYHLDSDDYKVGDYTYVEGMHNGERVWSVGRIEAHSPGNDYPYSIRTLYAGKVAEGVFDPTYFDRKEEWTALLDKAAEKNVSFATV